MYFSETTGKKLKCKTQNMEMHSVQKQKINVFNDFKKGNFLTNTNLFLLSLISFYLSNGEANP